jgi:RNA polymerase sigma-70 factor (ECF subfamily)
VALSCGHAETGAVDEYTVTPEIRCKEGGGAGHMHTVAGMASDGNVERYQRLFADHIDLVLGYALARVDPEAAKDAVAETFLVAWRRLDDVPDPARAWLLAVTRRTLAGQRRSRRRQQRLLQRLVSLGEGANGSGEFVEAVADRSLVVAALATLRPSDRELLCLIAWDGLDSNEVAEVLHCSPGAVAVRLHRARRRLEMALVAQDGLQKSRGQPTVDLPLEGGAGVLEEEQWHDDT